VSNWPPAGGQPSVEVRESDPVTGKVTVTQTIKVSSTGAAGAGSSSSDTAVAATPWAHAMSSMESDWEAALPDDEELQLPEQKLQQQQHHVAAVARLRSFQSPSAAAHDYGAASQDESEVDAAEQLMLHAATGRRADDWVDDWEAARLQRSNSKTAGEEVGWRSL